VPARRIAVDRAGRGAAAGDAGRRCAGPLRAPSLAAVPGVAGRPRAVRRGLVVLRQAAAALRGGRPVRAAVRRVPLPGRVRAPARSATGLPGVRLAHHGPGAEPAAGRRGPLLAVALASLASGGAVKQYLELLRHVLEQGTDKADRTGTGTRS